MDGEHAVATTHGGSESSRQLCATVGVDKNDQSGRGKAVAEGTSDETASDSNLCIGAKRRHPEPESTDPDARSLESPDKSEFACNPYVKAWIEVDGQKLPAYGEATHLKETRAKGPSYVVSCRIASQPGKMFSICGERRNVWLRFDVSVNDRLVKRSLLSSSEQSGMWKVERGHDGRKSKHFKFSTVDVTDACSTDRDLNIEKSGEIQIHFYRVKNVVRYERRGGTKYDVGSLDEPVQLHEEQKPLGVHSVVLRDGAAQRPNTGRHCTYEPIDHIRSPWYTFLFKYESIDYLQARRIAPRPSDVKVSTVPS
ncbi:hypothetical protein JB92DRAFT_1633969 [Gautieria morchelliformis]|nr:hypothetical protein JB92DRAFT_1633969 [Gautieria morchelliformis]